jgi:hypothetical protein
MLYHLGVKPSYTRPRVRDNKAYVVALLRTVKYKYCPEITAKGFADLSDART